MNKTFLVINPNAAGGKAEKLWHEQIKPKLDDSNLEYDFEFTKKPKDAIEITKSRVDEGFKLICAIGGDGTSNEVINGIMYSENSGIFSAIPIGSGNDVSSAFGIPEGDLQAAINCLIRGLDKSFDIGYCKNANRYFGGVASLGFDAEVAYRTNQENEKRSGGEKNYQIALIKTIVKFRPYKLNIIINEKDATEEELMFIAIGNGSRYGAGMHICPLADLIDGKFSITTLRKVSRLTLLRLFPRVYTGKHVLHKKVKTMEGASVEVKSIAKKCLYQADGEILGYLPEKFMIKPKALSVRVPDPWISYYDLWQTKLAEKKQKI